MMLIFIGESHEDDAAFKFLIKALLKLKDSKYKVFIESPKNTTSLSNADIILRNCSFLLSILDTFQSGVPKSIREFDEAQKRFFYEKFHESDISEEEDLQGLRNTYINYINRRSWLENRRDFIEKAKANNISIISIDVAYPEKYSGDALNERRKHMADVIRGNLNPDENGIVISGISHVVHTFELSMKGQDGFEEIFSKENEYKCKFFFVYSIENSHTYEEAIKRITKHKEVFSKSQLDFLRLSNNMKEEHIESVFSEINRKVPEKNFSEGIADELFKGIFTKVNKQNETLIKRLKETYNLTDNSIEQLEKGLRNSAVNGKELDIKSFIELGANINSTSKTEGKTALHYAIERGHLTCVQILLQKGAEHNIPDNTPSKKTALQYAKELNNAEILKILQQKIQSMKK